jgi:hypothetical protein
MSMRGGAQPGAETAAPAESGVKGASTQEALRTALPPEFFDSNEAPVLGAARTEHTVVPGIYFTPAVGSTATSTEGGFSATTLEPGAPTRYTEIALLRHDDLVFQERELRKRVAKLIDSNADMLSFDPDSDDADLVQARKENDAVVKRGEEQLEMMRRRLEYLDPLEPTKLLASDTAVGAASAAVAAETLSE